MKRLELVRVRICGRCGRGGAELKRDDGETLVVPLDPVHARRLAGADGDDVRPLMDVVLAGLASAGLAPGEVVLDAASGGLRALVSLVRTGEPEIVDCPAGEGIALAVRGGLKLYATDEALAHAASRRGTSERHGGTGGSDTLH